MNNFPQRLRALRKLRGLTQEALARAAELSVGTVSKLEEKGMDPKLSTLLALAGTLGVSLDQLAGIGQVPKRKPKGT
jgi:transcriptional regulator with XRE-family HTH domain